MAAIRNLIATLFVLAWLAMAPRAAEAAQSYDNCNNFVDSLPATISTQGVWCLRHDLSTNITSGEAITIAANNVTIDCNDFKLGGLAAGAATQTIGIYALNHQNATVRHCNIRGFLYGIDLNGGAGHLVEDNRLDNNLYAGIYVLADNSRVRRNAVFDTGGAVNNNISYGIYTTADIVDNTVSGVFADNDVAELYGILAGGAGTTVRGNAVKGLAFEDTVRGYGIYSGGFGLRIEDNHVVAPIANSATMLSAGVWDSHGTSFCMNNSVRNFSLNYDFNCGYSTDNAAL